MSPPSPKDMPLLCVDLDDLGRGVGELKQKSETLGVHVDGALPEESITISLDHISSHRLEGKRQAWATLKTILSPSPHRVASPCAIQGSCGGCALMPLAYAEQLIWKRKRVARSFAAFPSLAQAEIRPAIPSPKVLGYRNQAKYVYGPEAPGGLPVLGAYRPRTHRIIDQAGCQVVEPLLEELRSKLLTLLLEANIPAYDEATATGILRYVVMHVTDRAEVLVTWVCARREWPEANVLAERFLGLCPSVVGVMQNLQSESGNAIFGGEERRLAGRSSVLDRIGAASVSLASRSFFQANRTLAEALYAAVLDAAHSFLPMQRLVDVYSGAGGLAVTLAPLCREVVAIEENPAATQAASAFLHPSHPAITFFTGDAADGLRSLDHADLVVLNPPRKGCARPVLDQLCALGPRGVLYISCDPESLARDVAILVERGYGLRYIQPFDMMPQTPHVECLAVMEKA